MHVVCWGFKDNVFFFCKNALEFSQSLCSRQYQWCLLCWNISHAMSFLVIFSGTICASKHDTCRSTVSHTKTPKRCSAVFYVVFFWWGEFLGKFGVSNEISPLKMRHLNVSHAMTPKFLVLVLCVISLCFFSLLFTVL
jgi:hypothetical protein